MPLAAEPDGRVDSLAVAPSAVDGEPAAGPGDRIEVDAAGSYDGDTCVWSTDGLTVVGVNGRAKIHTTDPAQQKGIFTIAAMALTEGALPLREFAATAPERAALVLGTEGEGLTAQALAAADVAVQIPMRHGIDSLNVAAASAVAMWALADWG